MDLGKFYKQSTLPNLIEAISTDIPIPEKIGPYKIDALLSKGGMSLLYLGLHPEKHTPLVVKVLSPHYVKNQEMIDQFLKEAKIIAISNHPNIIKLYGQGEWEQGLYIAMEFIQGVSLKQFILQNSLSIKRSLEIILQVAYALLHLHTHGVIHRDLKPENILITEEGGIKVIDFGIAQLAQEEKPVKFSQGGLIGTPSYMSPEQKKDPLHVSYTTDIYALGVIAYELIIGKLSFGKIQLSYLPKTLQPIIQKAIAPALKDRYEDIVELITAVSLHLKSLSQLGTSSNNESHELFQAIETLQKSLLPPLLTNSPKIDIGIAKSKGPLALDLYYDMLKFANGNSLLILAETTTTEIDSITHIALLKGIIHGLLYDTISDAEQTLDVFDFVSKLNTILYKNALKLRFAFSALYLNDIESQFTYLSCGFDSLWHLSAEGKEPRIIRTDNPLLGTTLDFEPFETFDSWIEGDSLVLHSFNSKGSSGPKIANIDEKIYPLLYEQLELSAQAQSEAILDALLNSYSYDQEKHSHVVISLEQLF